MTNSEGWRVERGALQDHAIALVCLVACTLIYLWPLVSHMMVSIPGRPELADVTEYVWSVGWVRYALTHDAKLTSTDFLFIPFGADLRLHTQELLQSLMAFPFTGILGVIGAYNLILIITFLLNGILAYGLIHSIVRNSQAALVSATCLMLSQALVGHFIVGRLALSALWLVIAAVWSIKIIFENPNWLKGLGLGLVLLASAFTDLQILLFSVLWVAFFLFYQVFRNRGQGFSKQQGLAIGIAVLIFGMPFAIHYLPPLLSASDNGFAIPRLIDLSLYSFHLSDFANAKLIPQIYGFDFLISVIGAIALFRWSGEYRFWMISSCILLFLTLGPNLKPFDFPLPYAAISFWPPAMQFRTPYRLVLPALIGWTVITGLILAKLIAHIPFRWISWVVVFILVGGRLWYLMATYPFITQTYPDYQFYHWVADAPGDFAILEVPFGIRSGLDRIGDGGEAVQYYHHIHGKRLLNGSVSRLPTTVFEFYRSHPALMFLAGESAQDTSILSADFADVLSWSNTRFVVIHRSRLPDGQAVQIEKFLKEQPQLELFSVEGDLMVYHVK